MLPGAMPSERSQAGAAHAWHPSPAQPGGSDLGKELTLLECGARPPGNHVTSFWDFISSSAK